MHSKGYSIHGLAWSCTMLLVSVQVAIGQQLAAIEVSSLGKSITVKTPILKAPQIISIATGVPGIVEKVLVREGVVVNAGDSLLRIRDDEVRMSLQQADLSLELAELKANRDVEIRLAEKSSEVAEKK
ncbi:MAG: biotin/lipoyl-binding protein [Planctomycetes bacterium]|nr:biotin/lipoyl-binding protein [Planctomycetota bacterium]